MTEEPSNAVLAEKIDTLDDRIARDRQEEREYHARLDGRFDALAGLVATLQRQQDVDRATVAAGLKDDGARMDRHDQFHSAEAKTAEDRREHGSSLTVAISSAITAAAAIAATAVALLVR